MDAPAQHRHYRDPLPWNLRFREWLDEELEAGLAACDEVRWDNLRRQIVAEQKTRSQEAICGEF